MPDPDSPTTTTTTERTHTPMIKRIWHGWTTPEHADRYEHLLLSEIIPDIAAMNIPGYRGIEVLRREHHDHSRTLNEIEFITIMTFDSLENIHAFVGRDYRAAHVPDKARALLKRFDERAQHYAVRSMTTKTCDLC